MRLNVYVDSDIHDREEMRQYVQEDSPGYLARRLQEIYGRPTRCVVHAAVWILVLYVFCVDVVCFAPDQSFADA